MKISDIQIIETFKNSTSIREVILKLGLPDKGKTSNYIKSILLRNNIDIKEIENRRFLKTRVLKKCKWCGKEFYTSKVGKRSQILYCSHSCACHRKHSESSKNKLKETLKKKVQDKGISIVSKKICPICGKEFFKKTITCSASCGYIYRVKNNPITKETRKKLSQQVQKRIKEGKHNGWKTRNIESFPENFFKKVLDNNNISYEFNKPISKNDLGINENGCYFLDFALKNKIDLEIDGKQHLLKERKIHDIDRDKRLILNGWKVYRIAWKALPKNNEYIKSEIERFLIWYRKNI